MEGATGPRRSREHLTGLPGDGDRLEPTHNFDFDSYEVGTGYGHIALTVDDIDATIARLAERSSPTAYLAPSAKE